MNEPALSTAELEQLKKAIVLFPYEEDGRPWGNNLIRKAARAYLELMTAEGDGE